MTEEDLYHHLKETRPEGKGYLSEKEKEDFERSLGISNVCNSTKETEYIMSSPKLVKRIKEGEKEIREGKGVKINISDLWQ
ncbi:DUF2683 family protein [Parabacteroides sp.]